jgi:SagB-type dehydrogenase family enzyme
MSNNDLHICREYAEAVFRRAKEPMEPPGFAPDWDDEPSLYKIYQEVERLALPAVDATSLLSMSELVQRITQPEEEQVPQPALTMPKLALLLAFAHGVIGRRSSINPSNGLRAPIVGRYARGTASGGGLYPTEIYWASGAGSSATPGLYHYDNAHHSLARLLTGNVANQIQHALSAHAPAWQTNQFLIITVNFWKNAFKYNNFSYHVVTQDLGALLGSLWFLATGLRINWQPILWYQDSPLNTLLGLQADEESVCAVIPLPAPESFTPSSAQPAGVRDLGDWTARVHKPSWQRSKRVFSFPMNTETHAHTIITDQERPLAGEHTREVWGKGEQISLPDPLTERLQKDLLETFRQRQSNFGTFSNQTPLTQAELGTLLYGGALARYQKSDTRPDVRADSYTQLMVFSNHVEGLEQGVYTYDARRHGLRHIASREQEQDMGEMGLFLQQHYYLTNYSLPEVAAVIAIAGDLEQMLATYGNRGYRLLNAESGLVAQSIYLFSSALALGCGAVLGFNNLAMNIALGFDGTTQKSLLFLLVGHDQAKLGHLAYHLF